MWRAQAGRSVSVTNDSDSDDWDTNPDYENEIDDKGILRKNIVTVESLESGKHAV